MFEGFIEETNLAWIGNSDKQMIDFKWGIGKTKFNPKFDGKYCFYLEI